jgi:DNA-directed RNA polymerase beta subunit
MEIESLSYRAFKWFIEERVKEILNFKLYTNHKIKSAQIYPPPYTIKEIIERGDTLFYEISVEFEDKKSQNFLLTGPLKDGTFIVNGNLLIFQNELKDEEGIYFIKKRGKERMEEAEEWENIEEQETRSEICYQVKIVTDNFKVLKIEKEKGEKKIKIEKNTFDLESIEEIEKEIKKKIENRALMFSEKTMQKINHALGLGNIKSTSSLDRRHIEKIMGILKTEDEKFFKEENPSDISSKRIFHFGCFLENSAREFLKEFKERGRKQRFSGSDDNVLIAFYLFSFLNEKIQEEILEREIKSFTFLFPLNPLNVLSSAYHIQRYYGKNQEQLPKKFRDISESHKGILCPYETPESKLIGLSLHLLPDIEIDFNTHKPIPSPGKRILGAGASLIPFINFNDGVRISMASKNMKQVLPLEKPEAPYIKTGAELEIHKFIEPALIDKYFRDFFDKNSQEYIFGVNALVAYMPFRGHNFDDAIVISESFSKRCAVIKYKEYKEKVNSTLYEIKKNEKVKKGEYIKKGDKLWSVIYKTWQEVSKEEKAEDDGEVIIAEKYSDCLIESIYVQTRKTHILQVGDKLMNRHANKGVIGRILKDEEMPHLPDGTPVDVILNPMGIITRMNIGQLLETHFGFVHWFYNKYRDSDFKEKKKVEEFINKYQTVGSIFEAFESKIQELKEILKLISDYLKNKDPSYPDDNSSPGKLFLKNGKNGEYFKYPVVVGSQYIMVLNHLSEDKIWARGFPDEKYSYERVTGQPLSGKATNGGQRIGEMEVWSLLVHRAFNTITEIFAIDNPLNRKQIKSGKLKNVYLGNTFKAFCYYLKGLLLEKISGLDTEFIFKNGERTTDLSKEISSADIAKIKFIPLSLEKIRESIRGKKEITNFEGAIYRCPASPHIEKRYVFFIREKPVKSLRSTDIQKPESLIICSKCKGIVEVIKKLDREFHLSCKCPNATILIEKGEKLLCKEHDEEIQIYDTYHSAYNILFSPKIFSDERHSMAKIEDKIPVIPPVYRAEYGDRIFYESIGIHKISQAYKKPKNLEEIKRTFRDFLQPKEGFLREKLLKRIVNMSGRAVIVPAPELESIDECSLPFRILKKLFEREIEEWKKEFKEEISNHHFDEKIKKRLLEHLSNKKFILIRQPSLHKFNVLAFRCTKIREDNVIGINPLVCEGYNADFDGDQMAVFMPLTEEAQRELDGMFPSKNIYSYSGNYMFHLVQDIVVGFEEAVKNEMHEVIKTLSPSVNEKKLEEILKNNKKAKDKIREILDTAGNDEKKCETAQKIMQIGFEFATKYPVSFSFFDLYELKEELTERFDKEFDLNKITDKKEAEEIENKVTDKIKKYIDEKYKNSGNPVLKFIATGSRGNPENVKQMCWFKGLVWNPRFGEYNPKFFLKNPLVKGLDGDELFYMAYLSRDNLGDKKLTVAKAGEITRNLIEALYEVKIVKGECNCPEEKRGIENCKMDKNAICEKCFKKELEKEEFKKLKKCFPDDLSDFPVGILTAQTIGERATQLSMQAYHTGKMGVDIDFMEKFLKGEESSSKILKENPYNHPHYKLFFEILARKCGKKEEHNDWKLKESIKKIAEDPSKRDILSVITYHRGIQILENAFKENREIEVDFSTLKSKLILNKLIEKVEKVEIKEEDLQEYPEQKNYEEIVEVDEWDEFRGADEAFVFKFPSCRKLQKVPTFIIKNDGITWINIKERKVVKYIFEAGIDLFNKIKNKKKKELTPPSSIKDPSIFTQFKEKAIVQINFEHKKFEEFYKKGRVEEYEEEKIYEKLYEALEKEIKEFKEGRKGYSTSDLSRIVFKIEDDDSKRKKIEAILEKKGIPTKEKDRKKILEKDEEGYKNLLRRLKDEE